LPSGTVTLLFSDIEGSTQLLTRLGAAYAEALHGQRRILRESWADHGGIELGTEGDSFFVVFSTAEAAVLAAAQAQQALATHPWPEGEQVRVRMGIHTGAPTIRDGGYVGMDVHRAARIAAAAHGGQVVVSSATAELVHGCLPSTLALRDLGSHQLKDLPSPEHLHQLAIHGRPAEFPPLKSLGSAASLPRPATSLLGRTGELNELTGLLGSPDLSLVTLTGPGGSGKTRLALEIAHRLQDQRPDGVYFVPLAAATTTDVMWTTIAEVLGVPPEGRLPPGFFTHVAHRSALFVLDNLEQVSGADDVVTQLLGAAPQIQVIATSRRPLNVPGEHQHAVPPLELPDQVSVEDAERSGAVQLFRQRAHAVNARFTLDSENVAAVVEICRRLDGLPLAIELAAARTKLLTPQALLARVDHALDLAAGGRQIPARQKTMRDTIGWSYDLLDIQQQAFFRRLGVFSGGTDLDAVAAVAADILNGADPLDLVADLVDASLIAITADPNGEPRIGMLETIRAYAIDQLNRSGEADAVRNKHAFYYLRVMQELEGFAYDDPLAAISRAETELDNCREALTWAIQPDTDHSFSGTRLTIGLSICAALSAWWQNLGYLAEGRRWLQQAIDRYQGPTSPELTICLAALSGIVGMQGEHDRALDLAKQSVGMARELGDPRATDHTSTAMGGALYDVGDLEGAWDLLTISLQMAEATGDLSRKANALGNLAVIATDLERYDAAEQLIRDFFTISDGFGYQGRYPWMELNLAWLLLRTGRSQEADERLRSACPDILKLRNPRHAIELAELYVNISIQSGQVEFAARFYGAAQAMRERTGLPRREGQDGTEESVAVGQSLISSEEWERNYQLGRRETVEAVLSRLPST
jgi:predicted ATPase/class 3 adenylate cyclase